MRIFDRDHPLIPSIRWLAPHYDTRRGEEGELLWWGAGANWFEYGVVRYGNTPEQAIFWALFSVIGFRLTGNGYFPEKMLA